MARKASDFVVWQTVPKGNVCYLENLDVDDQYWLQLMGSLPFGSKPPPLKIQMSKRHKKETGLNDEIPNNSRLKISSPRVVAFLRSKSLKNVEYLPIKILDHKGKVASAEYCVVHPCALQPALDLQASKPEYNDIIKDQIDEVEKLVIDPKNIAPDVRLFRLVGYTRPFLVERALAEEIEKQKFVGPSFEELEDYEP